MKLRSTKYTKINLAFLYYLQILDVLLNFGVLHACNVLSTLPGTKQLSGHVGLLFVFLPKEKSSCRASSTCSKGEQLLPSCPCSYKSGRVTEQ